MPSTLWAALIAVCLLVFTLGFTMTFNWQWSNDFVFAAVFLFLLSVLTHNINLRALSQQGRAVIVPYLASTVLKLILSSVFLIVLVQYTTQSISLLVYVFLIYYATFSVLEIILVNRQNRRQKF